MNLDHPLVAAAAQISPVFMKKKESIEKYAECIHEAGRQGVDLVVTPETGILDVSVLAQQLRLHES